KIPFTPRAKKVLELALREALSLGHNYIGTEHILLGLVRENEGVAARILLDFDADAEKIRNEIIRMLSGPGRRQGGTQGSSGEKGKSSKLLDQFGRNFTKLASEGKLDPVVGRQTEIERIMQILSRRTKNNPVLIGEPGVGKTAVVEGLAQRIASNQVPDILKGKQIYSLDRAALRWSGASSRSASRSRPPTTPCRSSAVSATATRHTTAARSPTRRSRPRRCSPTATSRTAICPTRRST